jgi:hypothetical protein
MNCLHIKSYTISIEFEVLVSEEHVTSIFRAEDSAKQGIGTSCCLLYASFLLGLLFKPEDVSDVFLRNVG